MNLTADWGLLEWAVVLGFCVPIVVLCIVFVALACMVMDAERRDAHDEY